MGRKRSRAMRMRGPIWSKRLAPQVSGVAAAAAIAATAGEGRIRHTTSCRKKRGRVEEQATLPVCAANRSERRGRTGELEGVAECNG